MSLSTSLAPLLVRTKKIVKHRYRLHRADVLLVSHAKSGRTWLAAMISHIYHLRHGVSEGEIIRFDNFKCINPAIPSILFSHDNRKDSQQRPLFNPQNLYGQRTLLLVRDPRDVSVSSFFQRLRNEGCSPAHLPPIFNFVVHGKLPRVIVFLQRWAAQLDAVEQALVVRYEDLRVEPEKELARIMSFLDRREPDAEEVRAAVEFAAFENLRQKEASGFFNTSRLQPGDAANPDSFKVRRGKVGGYRDYFDDAQLVEIEAMIAQARLDRFGYRPNPLPAGALAERRQVGP